MTGPTTIAAERTTLKKLDMLLTGAEIVQSIDPQHSQRALTDYGIFRFPALKKC
jgi:hypothetical protein